MEAGLYEWLNLIGRWVHVITGIAWIGSSFFFNWLDARLEPPPTQRRGVEGELWMVHSGGFYRVEKIQVAPEEMPRHLHWFKWEAGFTWLSGIFLLLLIYYLGSGALLDQSAAPSAENAVKAALLGLLALSWIGYDLIWSSDFGQRSPTLANAICLVIIAGITYELCQLLSGVAAYYHVGAILGTCMAANVWMRIIPAQRALVAATKAGTKPDPLLGLRAKQRSIHNNYMTLPVVLIMISIHFPSTWGHAWNWALLLALALIGALVRHWFNLRNRGRQANWIPPVAALGLVLVFYVANFV